MMRRRILNLRTALFGSFLLVCFGGAVILARTGASPSVRLRLPWYLATSDQKQVVPGKEIALVFIGAPTCAFSNAIDLPEIVEHAKRAVREEAARRGVGFASIGVSQSSSARLGIEHLAKFGNFDEVASGRAWYNQVLLKYVYRSFIGPATTPQLVVLERTTAPESHPGIYDERVLLRQVGLGAIRQWVERGSPLPSFDE